MDIISREELGIADMKPGIPTQDPDDLIGITIHHTAIPEAPDSEKESRSLWQGIDNFHERDEYLDIAYSFGFDDFGQILEGRGWTRRTGANGTSLANATRLAFVYIGNSDKDAFNERAQDACAWLIGQAFKKGVGKSVVPHSKFVQTGCPGNRAENWVMSGAWKKDLPQPKQVQFFLLDDGELLLKSGKFPIARSDEELKDFTHRDLYHKRMHSRMVREGEVGNVTTLRKVI